MEIWRCCEGSKTSTIRPMVLAAPMVCRLDRIRCGLSSSHSSLDRFIVSHLSKKDYVRALAESGSQRYQIAFCVCADLPLADNTAIMSVQIFQRILQSNNMAFSGMVDLVHKAGHSSRFTASCMTCNQYHTLGKISSGHDIFRNMEDVWIGQFKSNHADHSCQGTSLSVSVHTESDSPGQKKRNHHLLYSGKYQYFCY